MNGELKAKETVMKRKKIVSQIATGRRILRVPAVMDKTGLSRATIYRMLGPLRIKLGANSAGWLESDIDAWISERVAASRTASD